MLYVAETIIKQDKKYSSLDKMKEIPNYSRNYYFNLQKQV